MGDESASEDEVVTTAAGCAVGEVTGTVEDDVGAGGAARTLEFVRTLEGALTTGADGVLTGDAIGAPEVSSGGDALLARPRDPVAAGATPEVFFFFGAGVVTLEDDVGAVVLFFPAADDDDEGVEVDSLKGGVRGTLPARLKSPKRFSMTVSMPVVANSRASCTTISIILSM